MGVIEFFILVVVVAVLGWLTIWLLGRFAPGHPPIIDTLVWIVVAFIVIVALLRATGIVAYDPLIPRIR